MRLAFTLLLPLFILYTGNAQNFNEILKAVASDRAETDFYGYSVAISGDYALVGSYLEDEDAVGLNTISGAGSVYIYERDSAGNWNEVQKIVTSDRALNDQFGYAVAISGDYAIIGARWEDHDTTGGSSKFNSGSAYFFERNTAGNWNQVQKIVSSDRAISDEFGSIVAISGDYAIVGSEREDEDEFDSNTMSESGSAYIFERDFVGNWNQVQKIVASDRQMNDNFGHAVSLSGDYAIITAIEEDHDVSGGNMLTESGSAYVFERDPGGSWNQVQKIIAADRAANDKFGVSVSVSGDYAIVGAAFEDEDASGANPLSNAGSAYVYERNSTGNWNQVQKIVAADRASPDNFGWSVSVDGASAIIGALLEDEDTSGSNTMINAGSAYLFMRDGGGNWNQLQKIVASDRQPNDYFATSVAISGNFAIVGAYLEDHNTVGTDSLDRAGSAYLFESCMSSSTITAVACDSFTSPSGNYTWTSSGSYMDTIMNTVGCDSIITVNLTVNFTTSATMDTTACDSFTSPSGNYIWTSDGIYMDTVPNIAGCDSVITLNLTVIIVDTAVTSSHAVLFANDTDAVYQWLDCENSHAPISGATSPTFVPPVSGIYAVEINKDGCVDTSSCHTIIYPGIVENNLSASLIVYPNPTTGKLTIDLGQAYNGVNITIRNILGQVIYENDFEVTDRLNIVIGGPKGYYLLEIHTAEGRSAKLKVLKE